MLRFSLYQVFPQDFQVYARFDDEPEPKRSLLGWFIMDFYGQEDLCLEKIAAAEAGATVLDLYNQLVDVRSDAASWCAIRRRS